MRLSSVFLVILLFIGTGMSCSQLRKGDASANNFRIFQSTEGFAFDAGSNSMSIRLQKSNPDVESLKAVAEGAAAGAVKGVTGKP